LLIGKFIIFDGFEYARSLSVAAVVNLFLNKARYNIGFSENGVEDEDEAKNEGEGEKEADPVVGVD
jgi:hypothetical protein